MLVYLWMRGWGRCPESVGRALTFPALCVRKLLEGALQQNDGVHREGGRGGIQEPEYSAEQG